MNALRELVNSPFKESFYKKRKKEKEEINVLIAFFISHKSGVKFFLKWIVNQCPKGTRKHDSLSYIPLNKWMILLLV